MRRLALLLLSLFTIGQAHSGIHHLLNGVELCLDSRSVEVSVNADLFPAALLDNSELSRRLEQHIITTLEDYEIPFRQQASCSGNGFLRSAFRAGPTEEKSYTFEAMTQVGPAELVMQTGQSAAPSESLYHAYERVVLLEPEVTQPELFLPLGNQQMIRDLAVHWWEDNPATERSFPWAMLGAAMVCLLLSTYYAILRRKAGVRSAKSSPCA